MQDRTKDYDSLTMKYTRTKTINSLLRSHGNLIYASLTPHSHQCDTGSSNSAIPSDARGSNFASPDCARPRVSTPRNGYSGTGGMQCNHRLTGAYFYPRGRTLGRASGDETRRAEKAKMPFLACLGVTMPITHSQNPGVEGAACPPPLVVSQLGVYSRIGGLTSVGRSQRQVEAQFDSLGIAIRQASHLGGLAPF